MKLIRKKSNLAPNFHLYPKKGWINDPCGCSLYKGEYHIFFQYHEDPTPLGAGKWYHMKSADLVEWEELGICLKPEFAYEKNGCWTGSSLEAKGKHYIFYSTNLDGRIPQQQPAVACSEDGIHYEKCLYEPLIIEPTPDGHQEMRDPKVFIRDETFYMLQGAARDGRGEIVGYKSADGFQWEYQGIFFQSLKWMGSMFECPDFFSIGEKDFLVFSPVDWIGHRNVLLCGKADFDTFTFECEQIIDLDLGSDFYAAQTMKLADGRIAVIGWLGSWGKPHPEARFGWAGMLTSLRIVHYDQNENRILLRPANELNKLRVDNGVNWSVKIGNIPITHRALSGMHKDILVKTENIDGQKDICLLITIKSGGRKIAQITFDYLRNLISVDKTMMNEGDNGKLISSCLLNIGDSFRLLLDCSAIEVFTESGQVITERIYPSSNDIQIFMNCNTGNIICHIKSYDMKSIYVWE